MIFFWWELFAAAMKEGLGHGLFPRQTVAGNHIAESLTTGSNSLKNLIDYWQDRMVHFSLKMQISLQLPANLRVNSQY